MDKVADTLRMLASQIDKKDGSVFAKTVTINRDFTQYAQMEIELMIDLSKIQPADIQVMQNQIGAGQ